MKVQIGGSQLPLFALVRWRAVREFVVVGEGLAIGLVAHQLSSWIRGRTPESDVLAPVR